MTFSSTRESTTARFTAALGLCLLVATLPLTSPIPAAGAKTRSEAARYTPRDAQGPRSGSTSLRFEPNRGQLASQVRYVARGAGFNAYFTNDGTTLTLHERADAPPAHPLDWARSGAAKESAGTRAAVRIKFLDAATSARPRGEGRLRGYTNYLYGSDSSKWVRNVPGYERLRYEGIYPGIDVIYYTNAGQLEYDVVVGPGADPSAVALDFEGARRVDLGEDGNLYLTTAAGTLVQKSPVLYQETDSGRRRVAGHYVLDGRGAVRFDVGEYDPGRPLVIDPIVTYGTYLGGLGFDSACDVAVDAAGHAIVVGYTGSFDYPVLGELESNLGGYDAVVSKIDANAVGGASLLYSTYIGGNGNDFGYGVAVDASGRIYMVGETDSADFPVVGGFQTSRSGSYANGYLAVLSADGSSLAYATYAGGFGYSSLYDVTLPDTTAGTAYVAGTTTSGDFPTVRPIQTAQGDYDVVVAQVDTTAVGSASLLFSTYYGGTGEEIAYGIASDASGNVYITGETFSEDYPLVNAMQSTSDSVNGNSFATRIDANGAGVAYSTYIGGSDFDYAHAIAVDPTGCAYIAGETGSYDFPGLDGFDSTTVYNEGFVVKLDPTGTVCPYASLIGGSSYDQIGSVAVAADGTIYTVGWTMSEDFPVTPGSPAFCGAADAVVTCIDTNRTGLSSLVTSACIGGDDVDYGYVMAFDGKGALYVVGTTNSPDMPALAGYQTTLQGDYDAFLIRLVCAGSGLIVANDSIGTYSADSSAFFLGNAPFNGAADTVALFGAANMTPLTGDWDGDGTDTIGVYSATTGAFFLRNTNAPGGADFVFAFGPGGPGWIPVVGDWDGDGVDTVGVFNTTTSTFFLKNTNAPGGADLAFSYGPAPSEWQPITGDWDGDGVDTIGLYDEKSSAFFLRNANTAGPADLMFGFGPAGMVAVAGDWNHDGVDTVGVFDKSTAAWFLTNANESGTADLVFSFGAPGQTPVTGDWVGR